MKAALLAMLADLPVLAVAGWAGAAMLAGLLLRVSAAAREASRALGQEQAALTTCQDELAGLRRDHQQQSARLAAILSGMSDGVQAVDSDWRLVFWNDRFPECTGVPRSLLRVGVRLEDILRAQAQAGEFGAVDVETEVARRLAILRSRNELGVVERLRPNGQVVELRRNPTRDAGVITLYTDITARRRSEAMRAERQRQAETTPLEPAGAAADLALRMQPDLAALSAALPADDPAADAARNLRHMAGEALLLGRLEAGGETPAPAPTELRALLEALVAEQAPSAARRDLRLVLHTEADLPGWLALDADKLSAILRAMLGRVIATSRPGTLTLSAARLGLATPPMLQLALRGPAAKASDGDGLALPVAARLAALLSGQMGHGASAEGEREIWLAVPLAIAAPGPAGRLAPPVVEAAIQAPPVRAFVLLVEDILVNQVVTATQLRRDGHRVDVADDGPSAIRMADSRPYDIVLMDLMMPGMSGFEATAQIRALRGPAARVPILALTADTSPETRARCREAGMTEMLSKPVRAGELAASMAQAIRQTEPPDPEPGEGGTGSDAALLSQERLDELREGLPAELFASIAEQCLGDMVGMLATLRGALDQDEPKAIDAAAHALAGMTGGYGLAAVERRMRRIMAAIRTGDIAAARREGLGMDDEAERSAAALRALLAAHAAGTA